MDDRYQPYVDAVESSSNQVYVTHREPNLEAYLKNAFDEQAISYQIKDIGPYRVYYELSSLISPTHLGLGPGQTNN